MQDRIATLVEAGWGITFTIIFHSVFAKWLRQYTELPVTNKTIPYTTPTDSRSPHQNYSTRMGLDDKVYNPNTLQAPHIKIEKRFMKVAKRYTRL